MPRVKKSRSFKDISLSFSRHPVTNDIIALKNEDAIKKSGETPAGLRWEMIMEEYFKEYSYELPRDEFEINPLVATKNIFNLLTNAHNVNLKSRRGKVYNWSGQEVKVLKDLVKK